MIYETVTAAESHVSYERFTCVTVMTCRTTWQLHRGLQKIVQPATASESITIDELVKSTATLSDLTFPSGLVFWTFPTSGDVDAAQSRSSFASCRMKGWASVLAEEKGAPAERDVPCRQGMHLKHRCAVVRDSPAEASCDFGEERKTCRLPWRQERMFQRAVYIARFKLALKNAKKNREDKEVRTAIF